MIVNPDTIPTSQLQGYLQSAIAPRPIAFASTVNANGQVNLSPFSFFNLFSANPPIVVFSPSRRVTNGTTKHTLENVLEVPEVVINIVNYSLVEQASLASTEYDRGVDEFEKAGLTPLASERVRPPRVGESPVSLECRVEQVLPLGDGPGAGNLVVCRVLLMHVKDAYLDDQGRLDTTKLDLVSRMGANWYCRANGNALFEIPKPLLTKGIGVDVLPSHARESNVLTGNNLARLGNLERLPTRAEIEASRLDPIVAPCLGTGPVEHRVEALHLAVRQLLEQGQTEQALAALFSI